MKRLWQLSQKFINLPTAEKTLLMESCVFLGINRAAILTLPFRWLTRSLKQTQSYPCFSPLSDPQKAIVLSVGHAIQKAARYTPWESACLAQALTAQRMLQRRKISGIFYLGVMKDANDRNEQLKAHAWSQCGDVILTGQPGHERFTIVSAFIWDPS
jgi:hypothetical protein